MKLVRFAGPALLMVTTAAFASDNKFERTLNVSDQPDLYVSTGSGNITIHAGTDKQIQVVGHVHAGWNMFGIGGSVDGVKGHIQRIIDNPPIVQEGNTVRIGETNDHELYNNVSVDYDISVPASVALNVHSGSGDVEIDHVARFLAAGSGSGNVRAHGVHGPAELGTGSGNIELEEEGPGDVKAKTGSGNINIHGFNGVLTARSGSGDIDAEGRLTGPANLAAGSGNIKLHLTSDAHFNLEASTGSGDIHVNYPGAPTQGDNSRHHLTAPINGGGAPLEVRTGSGDVEIDSH
jgi:DUF4097 and DUF4098 domain-containing protein YvlB